MYKTAAEALNSVQNCNVHRAATYHRGRPATVYYYYIILFYRRLWRIVFYFYLHICNDILVRGARFIALCTRVANDGTRAQITAAKRII